MSVSSRWPARVALLLAVIAVGSVVFRYGIRDHVIPKNFGVVDAGAIYRSGKLTPATFRKVVEGQQIKTIVDLGAWEAGTREDDLATRTARSLGVTRYRMDLEGDATGNPNYYVQALRLLTDPAKQPVLVHCGAGAQRTGATFILYRHFIQGMPLEEAFTEAERYGHCRKDNPKLKAMLEKYDDAIMKAFREGGSVPGAAELPTPEPVWSPGESARAGVPENAGG